MKNKLSQPMTAMLKSLSTGDPYRHLHGRSAHGGGQRTAIALLDHGYATGMPYAMQITQKGRDALKLSGTPNE